MLKQLGMAEAQNDGDVVDADNSKGYDLVNNQVESDDLINDVCCMVGCNRRSLKLNADTGMVVGCLRFRYEGEWIDCRKKEGVHIPKDIDVDKVGEMDTDASFILLVKKETIFGELADKEFYKKLPCIIITGKRGLMLLLEDFQGK